MFRKTEQSAIDLIEKLLEYTPTKRLSAIDALADPFFDELRQPGVTLPPYRDSEGRRPLPKHLFDFTLHGMQIASLISDASLTSPAELSIAPHLNHKLLPTEDLQKASASRGLDINNLQPLTKDQMMARLD